MPFRVQKNDQSLVRVSLNDAQADFLYGKISVGAGLTASIANPGANETVHIVLNVTPGLVLVSSGDTTDDYLENKIVAGANIILTKLNTGANEQIQIAGASAAVKIFPTVNAVYVDQDVSNIPTGQVGYNTLNDALVSWQPGGDAATLFGAPSASNPGLILVGVGTFAHVGQAIDNLAYVSIRGISKELSIIDATANDSAYMTNTSSHMKWQNLSFKYKTTGANNFFCANCDSIVDFEVIDCKFSGGSSNAVLSADNPSTVTAKFTRCDFTELNGGMTILDNVQVTGAVDFIECTCTDAAAVADIACGNWSGRMENCYLLGTDFTNRASGSIKNSTVGAINQASLLIEGSHITDSIQEVDASCIFINSAFQSKGFAAPCIVDVVANWPHFHNCTFIPETNATECITAIMVRIINGYNLIMSVDIASNITINGSRVIDPDLIP